MLNGSGSLLKKRRLRRELAACANELGLYGRCNEGGSADSHYGARRVTDAALVAHLGAEVSARLWYCPKCERPFCIAYSKWVQEGSAMGIGCPRCRGDYVQEAPEDRTRPLISKWEDLAKRLDQLEPGATEKLMELWVYGPR